MSINKEITFYSYDLLPDGIVKPSAYLRHMQQAAREDLDRIGLTYETLRNLGYVFVLTNLKLSILRPLRCYDTARLTTWEKELRAATFTREFTVAQEGKTVAAASSKWCLIDFSTRKIVRHFDLPVRERESLGSCGVQTERRIDFDGEYGFSHWKTVQITETDENRHLNNTRYADIALDAIGESLSGCYAREMQILYSHEALLNDTLCIEKAADSSGNHYVRGTNSSDNTKCFEIKVILVKYGTNAAPLRQRIQRN